MIEEAVDALRDGRFVLLHDGDERENEVDMIVAAQSITPEHVACMRMDAGGLLCTAIRYDIASKLGLSYMHDILARDKELSQLLYSKTPYGDLPAFSITVNHRETYTGITDHDRALTISKIAEICRSVNGNSIRNEFISSFKAPGHVPLLIAAKNLLKDRQGHTELAVYLAELAGIVPVVAICEMLDAHTYRALAWKDAERYAEKKGLVIVNGEELKSRFK